MRKRFFRKAVLAAVIGCACGIFPSGQQALAQEEGQSHRKGERSRRSQRSRKRGTLKRRKNISGRYR